MSLAPEAGFKVHTRASGGRTVVELAGEIDGWAAQEVLAEFRQQTAAGANELTLDLQEVTFIDSAGLRAVIQIERLAAAAGLSLEVVQPTPEVAELLRITGLSQRLGGGPQRERSPLAEFSERYDLTITSDLRAPARARTYVREALSELTREQLAVTTLLVSELVTNAVIHPAAAREDVAAGEDMVSGEESVRLIVTVAPAWVRLEVLDSGAGFDAARPTPRSPDRGGRGLLLVGQLATRWGAGASAEHSGRFAVWMELELATLSLPR